MTAAQLSLPETDAPPLPQSLVINYAIAGQRGHWLALFGLDTHLANLVRQAREPLLGQMRLAWWRDRLGESPANWPKGNPLLALIADSWGDDAAGLVHLVDGWEYMLVDPPLEALDISGFARGRAASLAALGRLFGVTDCEPRVVVAAERWAFADLAARTSDHTERAKILELAEELGNEPVELPREYRPLAILDGLARRSLNGGGGPLFSGRGAALTALRLGLIGR